MINDFLNIYLHANFFICKGCFLFVFLTASLWSRKQFLERDHPFRTSAFLEGRGQKLAIFADGREVGVKNHENLPTSLMDGPKGFIPSFQL